MQTVSPLLVEISVVYAFSGV